uniref:Peptidase M50 domain-containing protein n=1 Tax=Schlesneria paludicola TaxID=360056 RepID=A0A7C4QLP4_9PLAN
MTDRLPALYLSFPVGRLFGTQVRVSVLFLAVGVVFGLRFGWHLGTLLTGLFFLSILLHEFGHVALARWTGGLADEVLLWPLGGLALVQPAPRWASQVSTILGGPLVNLLLCLLMFPGFYAPEMLWGVLNPFQLPVAEWSAARWWHDLLLLGFCVNWVLLLLNLLPVFPLDGGQLVQVLLSVHYPGEVVFRVSQLLGNAVGMLLFVCGLGFGWLWVLALGAILLLLNLALSLPGSSGEAYDESFLGYDFSQGYTSLERSHRSERPVGWFDQWKQRRREERLAREARRRAELEQQLDFLLAKVHAGGLQSLTSAEKRLLRRASEELRDRARRTSRED